MNIIKKQKFKNIFKTNDLRHKNFYYVSKQGKNATIRMVLTVIWYKEQECLNSDNSVKF